MGIEKITSSSFVQSGKKNISKVCTGLGEKISEGAKADTFKKVIKKLEPNGANNSFFAMAGLMIFTVILPRVKTAMTRNPDNKEATKDEITEILFRDCQTVAIMLFALKIINSLISGNVSRVKGLPMTNKPYQKVFDHGKKGLQGIAQSAKDFMAQPLDKLKKGGRNVIDTINPIGGVVFLKDDEFVSKYSGYGSIEEIQKLFGRIKSENGDSDKIFNNVVTSLIQKQQDVISNQKVLKNAGVAANSDKAKEILDELINLKEKGLNGLSDEKLSENVKNQLVDFFKNPKNDLVMETVKLSSKLKTVALAIESLYLGFGLPALNQKRLERKYLKNKDSFDMAQVKNAKDPSLINKNIKANEIKLYQDFIK